MAKTYDKPALTFDQQIALLVSRGMVVPHHAAARRVLESISYYRLSAYAYPFRVGGGDAFAPNTSFDRVVQLYEFDRRMRLVMLDAIERVEVAVRTKLTCEFALRHGPFGHRDPTKFERRFHHGEWLTRLDEDVDASRETFVQHYRTKYDGFPSVPLWMATEVMSFGSLTRLYKGCELAVRVEVARVFGCHESVLGTWLLCLNYVRNLCAHHSRVWNRDLSIAPKIPNRDPRWRSPELTCTDRAFAVLLILREALRALGADGAWAARTHADLGADLADPFIARGVGLQGEWSQHPIWRGP